MRILKFNVIEKGPPAPVFNVAAGRPAQANTYQYSLCNGGSHVRVIISTNIFAEYPDADPMAIIFLGKCDESCKAGIAVDPESLPAIVPLWWRGLAPMT